MLYCEIEKENLKGGGGLKSKVSKKKSNAICVVINIIPEEESKIQV